MNWEHLFPYVANVFILITCYDAISWSCTLIRHAFWMQRHSAKTEVTCSRVTHNMLLTASILSGIHLILINLAWIKISVFYGYTIELFILIAGVNIMAIHMYALLARCTLLNRTFWPLLSAKISNSNSFFCKWYITMITKND